LPCLIEIANVIMPFFLGLGDSIKWAHWFIFIKMHNGGKKEKLFVCKFWNEEYSFVGVEKVNLNVRGCMIPII
jgi:hypothetical protein